MYSEEELQSLKGKQIKYLEVKQQKERSQQ